MLKRLLLPVLLALPFALVQAAEFSSLEERMSESDFRAAGLDQLTPEQLARLNDWLRRNGGVTAGSGAPSAAANAAPVQDTRGLPVPRADGDGNDAIVSRLTGEFSGWHSGSRFELENGMVWETSGAVQSLHVRSMQQPTVRIEPAFFGTWILKVEGYNSSVRVKRIR